MASGLEKAPDTGEFYHFISGVPNYEQYGYWCGYCAGAMVLACWDGHGYPLLQSSVVGYYENTLTAERGYYVNDSHKNANRHFDYDAYPNNIAWLCVHP